MGLLNSWKNEPFQGQNQRYPTSLLSRFPAPLQISCAHIESITWQACIQWPRKAHAWVKLPKPQMPSLDEPGRSNFLMLHLFASNILNPSLKLTFYPSKLSRCGILNSSMMTKVTICHYLSLPVTVCHYLIPETICQRHFVAMALTVSSGKSVSACTAQAKDRAHAPAWHLRHSTGQEHR